jgi:hypothetical protein
VQLKPATTSASILRVEVLVEKASVAALNPAVYFVYAPTYMLLLENFRLGPMTVVTVGPVYTTTAQARLRRWGWIV